MKKRDPNDGEIGKRVRALRLQRGTTQVKLGAMLDVTFQQIQKYENGANRISAGRLQRIADVFDVPITFFYTGIGENRKSHDNGHETEFELFQTGDVIRLVRAYSQIKERGVRLELLRLTEAIATD